MDSVLKIFDPAIVLLWDHGIKHVTYIFRYTKNFEELNKKVKRLEEVKERLDRQRDEAKRKGHIVEARVEEWLGEVGEFESRVENYRNNAGHKKTRGFYYFFPYYRHKLGRQAKNMEMEALELKDESPKVDEVSHAEKVTSFDLTLSNSSYIEFDSRKSIVKDIMRKLKDPNMKIIGLHGSQGMGKSTLIKKIANKAKDEGLFDRVAEIDVTANLNPLKIQEDIAHVLGLPLAGESENVRADYLRRWLKIEIVSILIILDNVNDKLDLNRLGIPVDDDYDLRNKNKLSIRSSNPSHKQSQVPKNGPNNQNHDQTQDTTNNIGDTAEKVLKKANFLSNYKGCKVLLSSRDKKLFPDEVDVESIFCLKELDDNDSLRLFEKEAGGGNKMSMPKEEIKNYCTGIPMTIIRFAKRFKSWIESESEPTLDKFKVEWEKSREITNEVKYDFPKNEELKFIYLLCAQMGPLPLIMDLVKYCFGLGIFEGVSLLSEARHKINKSIHDLQDLGLVSYKSPNTHFTMSHIIRGDALSNAHKDHNIFALRDGKLDDWPELEKCTSISICNSDIIDGLPRFINCPQLKFLQIDTSDPSLEIPESFFERMENLKVLLLTGFRLSSLPYSIECLSNLRMFSLERCTLDCNLSLVRKLKKLRILSFSGSQLNTLPAELRYLNQLRLLDISDCFELKIIPPNLLSSLTCLEELYISKSLIKMLVETDTNKGQNSFLSELTNLHQLKVVDISIPCVSSFPNQLFFDKLKYYKIEIGDFEMISVGEFRMPNKYKELKVLALQLKDDTDIHSHKGIKLLFKTTQTLLLGKVGVQNVVNELNIDGFQDLKHLSIINNNDVKYVNSTYLSNCVNIFPNLESLCLCNMMNLKMICDGPITLESFAKLKTIKVEMCYQLGNLFSIYAIKISTSTRTSEIFECNSSMKKFLASLEKIEVCECKSLKEIFQIPMDCDKVEFLKLRTLTLQSLPLFTCFTKVRRSCWLYSAETQTTNRDHTKISTEEDDHSDTVPPLFGELVEVPNLENMNLFSLNIYKIWSDQHLSSFYFQNLIRLVVKDCDKLTHLCSLPMASSLKKLKSLIISGCFIMENIFEIEGISANKVCCVFPKLEEIHLSNMKRLRDIWHTKVNIDSFSSLISVNIEQCNQLEKIFPSHMEGWFESLINLKVSNCKSVKEIFEVSDSEEIDVSGGIDTNLQVILLEDLPNLKELWSKDPHGIFNFKKLQTIDVSNCDELRNLFPASMAKDVSKLERMSILHCERMVEIVSSKDASEDNNDTLEFPELSYVRLYELPNIKQFYKGRHPIKFPKLKELSIGKCINLNTFPQETSETTSDEKFVFSIEVVFPKLEYLEIDFPEAQSLLSKYQMHNLKELIILSSVQRPDLLYPFLYKMPNLEKLKLTGRYFELLKPDIGKHDRLGVVLQLKQLFIRSSNINDLGFDRDQVLQRLELLSLKGCYNLNTLAPSSVSLSYLTCLKLKNCRELRNLMTSSTAKSMVQLTTMKVINCDKIEQIISMEESEEGKVMKLVFSKLIFIELVGLKNLASFCSYKECEFEFPSLEILIIRGCPKMEKFSEKRAIAPKLKDVFGVEGDKKAKWQWKGDLNATLQKVFSDKVSFAYTEDLRLDDNNIQHLWDDTHWGQQNNFGYLKRLRVWFCDTLKHIIPSHLLSCFHNLEELDVFCCSNAEVIFNMNDENRVMTKPSGIFRLKILSLDGLPQLKHVWDKDPEGVMGLQLLKEMRVEDCESLKSLFPASVVKDLTRLEVLEVRNCEELVEIFWKDEKGGEGERTTQEFVFRDLTSLTLKELPALKYSIHCSKQQESISNMRLGEIQELCLGSRPIPNSCFGLLDSLIVDGCKFSSDVLLPFSLLSFLAKLETLEVRNCVFVKVIFDVKRTSQDTIHFPLKKLTLSKLPDLENVWNEDPHGILNMCHLQELHVEECKGLTSMFPASGAKEVLLPFNLLPFLTNLVTLEVRNCDDVKAIFDVKCTTQGRDVTSTGLPLPFSLKNLTLSQLSNLKNVWNEDPHGILNMCHLQEVHVEECKSLTSMFPALGAKEVLLPFNLLPFLPNLVTLEVRNCDDVKAIFDVKCTTQDKDVTSTGLPLPFSLKNLTLSQLSNLKNVWNEDPHGILNMRHLQEVHVEKCKGLESVFPTSVAKDLVELESLVVKDCERLMTIVVEDNTNGSLEFTFPCPCVRSLNLRDLPKFKYFYYCSLKCHTYKRLESNTENQVDTERYLILGKYGMEKISGEEFQRKLLKNLKVFGWDVFQYEILDKVPNIEKLVVCYGSFEEMFCRESPNNVNYSGLLLQLKELRLESLEKLVSIGLENSWTEYFVKNLETFEVISCSKLKNVVASKVFLSNLTYLKIKSCDSLQYLFTSSTAKTLDHLKTMEIESCDSIEEIVFKMEREKSDEDEIIFPKLIRLNLDYLWKLRLFYGGRLSFPSLEELSVTDCPEIETFCTGTITACKLSQVKLSRYSEVIPIEHDLNETMQKEFLEETLGESWIDLKSMPRLHEIWKGSRQIPLFSKLITLTVIDCQFLSDAVLPFYLLSSLPELEILEVRKCDSVKTIFDVNPTTEEDRLINFPLKKLVLWELPRLKTIWNKDPHGILSISHLEEVSIDSCKRLKSVFPASLAKDFGTLEDLTVEDCEGLMTIVAEENTDLRGTNVEVTFPWYCVRSLKLRSLPKLKYFYYYTHVELEPEKCMTVGENGMKMILRGEFERNLLESLKTLTLCFGSDVFPCKILEVVPNIEKLVVCDGSFKKMFCCESGNNMLQQLKVLRLEFLEEMVSIGQENSWTDSFVRNLETFEVIRCKSLKNLLACTVSFSNLRCLKVEDCDSLSYLLTSSAAKRLGQLKKMEIKRCGSIEEIVYKEDGEESDEDEIIFPQLTCLNLHSLWKLKRFYRGSLGFPSLEELSVTYCDEMITLCEGSIEAGKLSQVIDKYSDAIQLETELNSTMRKKYLTEIASSKWKKSLEFRDRADLQEIWRLSLQIFCFTCLETLIVNKCKISSDALLPFTLLSLLPKLETLEVHNCDSVKTIFDVNSSTQVTVTLSLKKLVLRNLPNLETVCSEVTEANPTLPEGTNPKLTFPYLTSLTLLDLPNFNSAPTFELIIPNLEHLRVGKNELKMIVNGEFQRNLLHKLKVLGLCFDIECDEFPEYGFLQKLPNVMKLVVCDSSFKVIFWDQRPNNSEFLLQLKELRMESLQELVSIGLENSWTEPFVRNLETFEVIKCSNLKNLITCRVSFSNLICLKVENCDSLSYLFISSTAKSLAKLEKMEIEKCESIEEIVSKEGEESDEDEIIFPKLNCLSLKSLKNLQRFYKGSLSFPLLEELSIRDCDDMVTLCPGTLEASKLSQVKLGGSNTTLKTDLNSTMKKEFLETISELHEVDLQSGPTLQEIWNGSLPIPGLCFSELTKLTVNDPRFLSDAVLPFHLLPLLPRLKTLEVGNSDYVKTIFDVKCATKDTSITFPLKKLILSKLPNLENVWNEDPHRILCMQHLEEIHVKECKGLKSVFPASAAKSLVGLEDLVVEDCEGLMAIVADESKEGDELDENAIMLPRLSYLKVESCNSLPYLFTSSTAKGLGELKTMKIKECKSIQEIVSKQGKESDEDEEIIFKQLEDLYLEKLDELGCFYSGNLTLSLPSLEEVHVIKCSSMKTFSAVNKINHPTKWYCSEYERPQKESDLNSAVLKTSAKKAPDASSAIISVLQ